MSSHTVPPLEAVNGVNVTDIESTSIHVLWEAVENADRYIVTLTKTKGAHQQGLCPSFSHTVSVVTTILSVVVGQTDDDMLRAYTTYSITVVVENDMWPSGRSNNIDSVTLTTKQTSTSKYTM